MLYLEPSAASLSACRDWETVTQPLRSYTRVKSEGEPAFAFPRASTAQSPDNGARQDILEQRSSFWKQVSNNTTLTLPLTPFSTLRADATPRPSEAVSEAFCPATGASPTF